MNLDHQQLIKRGVRWLSNTVGCQVVVTELSSGWEIPDVLGWRGITTHLVEAKASVSDFKADMKKPFRSIHNYEMGLGNYRYYIVPMAIKDKVIDLVPSKWGLLAVGESSVFLKKKPEYIEEVNRKNETEILISIIRRIAIKTNPLKWVNIKNYIDPFSTGWARSELFTSPEDEVCRIVTHVFVDGICAECGTQKAIKQDNFLITKSEIANVK